MKLSVALCTYNGAKYIAYQLHSIANQKLPVNQIVICDDGSKDDTLEQIVKVSSEYPAIEWIIEKNKKNLGVTRNFEKALSLCTGDVLFLSDQDDIWHYDKTEKIVNYLNENPKINLVFSDATIIDENGNKKTQYTLFDAVGLSPLLEMWSMGLSFEIENVEQRLLGSTFGLRKKFVKSCLPFSSKITNYHDGQLAIQAIFHDCIGFITDVLTDYRIHGNNVVGLKNNWIFKCDKSLSPDSIGYVIEPRIVKKCFYGSDNKELNSRVYFYEFRYKNYTTITGKILLLFSICKYLRFYKKYWWRFYINDITYGVLPRLKKYI